MATYQGIAAAIVAYSVFLIANGQAPGVLTPIEKELRQNLTKLVQFVIDPSATPSMELINFALAAGGSPKTSEERIVYLGMMKKIARNTPASVNKFTKDNILDEAGLDAHVTMRALQYVQNQQKEVAGSATNQMASTATADVSVSGNTVSNTPQADVSGAVDSPNVPIVQAGADVISQAANVDNTNNSGNLYEANLAMQIEGLRQVALQEIQKNNIVPATDGTISLEDMFTLINNYNAANNQGNNQL